MFKRIHYRRSIIYFMVSLFLIVIIGYGIGYYFVSYALVPNQGGQNRQVTTEQKSTLFKLSKSQTKRIKNNKQKANQIRDQWLKNLKPLTTAVHIKSYDNLRLSGHTYLQENPSHKWVILVHGYQSNEEDALQLAPNFYRHGYNILSYDMRAHDQSEGDYIGMGILDRYDLLSWTQYLVKVNPKSQIVYHGTSMGGATVLMTAGLDLPENVKVIVSDCAYASVWDIFAFELKQRFNLPSFPVLYLANGVANLQAGYSFTEDSPLIALKNNRRPILYIHSQKDDFVPIEMLTSVYNTDSSKYKEKLIINEAHHADAKHADPDLYYQTIFNFLEKHMAN